MLRKLSLLRWIAGLSILLFGGVQIASAQNKLEPTGPPGPTMKTLDEIPPTWSQIIPTAQRFQSVLGGEAVLDRETGLVWQREPWGLSNALYNENWVQASEGCYSLHLGGRMGFRLPTVEELLSLMDPTTPEAGQFLPSGHPFTQISSTAGYWTATTAGTGRKYIMTLELPVGSGGSGIIGGRLDLLNDVDQTTRHHAWCVRGGHGHDGQ